MKFNNILALCLFCFISCSKYESKATIRYQSELKLFPPFMVDFFPDSLSGKYSTAKNIDTTNHCIYYMNYDLESKKTAELKKHLTERCMKKYIASDTLLVTIKTESVIYWDDSKEVFYESIFYNNNFYYPLPFFEKIEFASIGIKSKDIFSNVNISGLSNDFEIFIIDCKPGLYWKGLKPNKYMPLGWENGYSKGVCINERESITIYWVIIW